MHAHMQEEEWREWTPPEKSQLHLILWTHNAMNSHILTTCTERATCAYNHFLLADNSPLHYESPRTQ